MKKITVYSTTFCGTCQAVMGWLDNHKIHYKNRVVDESAEVMQDFLKVTDGELITPLTVVEEQGKTTKIRGFDYSKLKALRP